MASAPDLYWQCNKSLIQCLDYMFTHGLACDVTFLVGEGRYRISAHRTILACRSPVFYAMLAGKLAEGRMVVVPDISKESFLLLLRYLYTDDVPLTVCTVTSVLSAARKYCVDQLVKRCEEFQKDNITVENACLLLEHAHAFMEEKLKENCLRFIYESRENVLQTSGFVELCDACVKSITESDDLAVEESVVYEAVMRWSEVECGRQGLEVTDTNRREVLGDIIYTVRFPIMNRKYFTRAISFCDILTTDEITSIFNGQNDEMSHLYNFNSTKRNKPKPKRGQYESISRFRRTRRARRHIWNSTNGNDSISFRCSDDVYLHGLMMYGAQHGCEEVNIGVYRKNGETVYRGSHYLSNRTYSHVVFDDIVSVSQGETIDVVIHGGMHATAYGMDGKTTVMYQDVTVTFINSTLYPCVCTNTSQGQIPGLLLSV